MSAATVDPEREPGQEESPLTPVPLKSELGRDSTMGEEESGFASPDGSDCTHHETHVSAPIASVGIFASVSAAEAKEVEVEGQQSPQVVEGERESVTTEMQALIASLCTLDDEVRRRLIKRSDPTCCSVENGPEEMNGERPLPVRTECLGGEADEGEEERKAVDDVDEISFDASVQRSLEKHLDSSTLCSEEKMNVCKGEIELQIAISSAPPPAHESGDGVTEVARRTGCENEESGEDGAMQSHFQQPAMSSISLPNSGSEQKCPTDVAVAKAVAELHKSQEMYDQAYMNFTQLQLQLQTLRLQKIEPPAQVLQVLHQLEQQLQQHQEHLVNQKRQVDIFVDLQTEAQIPQRAAAVAKHQSQLSETPAHKSNGEKRIELRRKPTKKQRIREEKLKAQIARWQEQRRSENEKVEQAAARLREREKWEASEAARLHKEKHREY